MKLWKTMIGAMCGMVMLIPLALPVQAEMQETQSVQEQQLFIVPEEGQTTPQFHAGETVDLTIKIKNRGGQDTGRITISPILDEAKNWPFEIASMNNDLEVANIEAGASRDLVWKEKKVREDVESGYYKLTFRISGDAGETQISVFAKTEAAVKNPEEGKGQDTGSQGNTPTDNSHTLFDKGGITNMDPIVSGGGSTNASVPRVIVTGFRTEPGEVNAGSNFRLIISLQNTSARTAVSNMLFDMQAPSAGTEAAAEAPAFLPASGSSSIYLDYIPAGGTKEIAIDLNARADLIQKPYSIAMSMKYEDSSAVQYESSSSLAIPVKQAARFELSDIEIAPGNLTVGDEANITCSLYNTGRVKLYNVKVKIQGDGIEAKDIFVGNVESGATGMIDGILTAVDEKREEEMCRMVISYEDESGKQAVTEKEFSLTVTQAQPASGMTNQEVEMEVPKKFPALPILTAAGAVILAVSVVLWRRKKRKNMALLEEEELLNEVDRFTEDE